MRKVLVTGASGFIGRHVLTTLIAHGDYEVHAVTSPCLSPSITDCIWHTVDLLKFEQVNELLRTIKPTDLLHFAWCTTPGAYWNSHENFRWVQAGLELLVKFQEYGGQRVVMAGTCAEYDWSYGYCSESITPKAPTTIYGTCKLALQTMLEAYSQNTGLSSAWGRIFFVYGPHESPQRLVPLVIRAVLQGEIARCSHGNYIRDFLYVQDVADAFVSLLESDVCGPVNIASGYPVVLKDIIFKIADRVYRRHLIQFDTLSTSADEPQLFIADVSRLHNEVGWWPKYDLDSGLDQTVEWWKTQLDLVDCGKK